MRDKDPFAFAIGLVIFVVTSAAVIQFMTKPPLRRPLQRSAAARTRPQVAITPGLTPHKPAVLANRTQSPSPARPEPAVTKKAVPATTPVPVVPLPPAAVPAGIIAVVIDDWGYTLDTLPVTQQIHYPVTAAVLPRLAHSREVAQKLQGMGHEIILHLPMEPTEKVNLEKETVTTRLSDTQILAILDKDLADLTYAKGVSNHMGSKATRDERVMNTLLKELKRRNLYFLDSYVVLESIGSGLAQAAGVPCVRRDVFLDNKLNPDYIKRQIERLKAHAKHNGYAVGIGHDRMVTLKVLRDEIPKMAREGYRLVTVSELIRNK